MLARLPTTITTLVSLRSVVHALRGWPTPLGVAINVAKPQFAEDGSVVDPALAQQLDIVAAQVVDQLLAFREEVGDFGTLLYCGIDWVDPRVARRSLELMAEQVMPAVNSAIGA